MAKEIAQPVGPGLQAAASDILTVQTLLKQVPQHAGGPSPAKPIMANGVFTPELWAAVNAFQAKDPSMRGETQRMTPDGPTIAKLNAFDSDPPLSISSQMMCPHGGQVSTVSTGKMTPGDQTLSPAAVCMINGCPNYPNPCARVQWQAIGSRYFLDRRSVGLCINNAGAPGGPVMIVRA